MKPAFWSDARLAELPESTRLFYIGLWMIADDAGWLRWDPIEAARDLYGYEGRAKRERRVLSMFAALEATGRVVLHDCGHAEIPRMTTHQRLSGTAKQVQTVWKAHQSCISPRLSETSRDSPQVPADARHGTEREQEQEQEQGMERNGKGNGNGSAPALAPKGARSLPDETVPDFLRTTQ